MSSGERETIDSPPRVGPAPVRVLLIEINEDGTTGGSHQALLDLVVHLDRRCWTPVVLCYQDNAFVPRYRKAGADVHVWERVRHRERGVRGPWWVPWRAVTQAAAIRRRLRFLRGQRIGLVHANNSPSHAFGDWLIAARLAGIPCISHVRGILAKLTPPARLLIPRFDRLIAISASVEAHIADAGVRRARITRIYDGIDADAIRSRVVRPASAVRRALGVADDCALAIMVGHLRPWKGQHVVLEAVRALPTASVKRFHLAFVGGADPYAPAYEARLHELAAAPGLARHVTFLGARDDVPELMSAADVVIHASTVAEPFGLVVVEAMALGRPVIASVLGGPGEIVTPGTGWTFDPGKPGELASHLERVIATTHPDEGVQRAARRRAAAFGVAATVSGVERVYREVLGVEEFPPESAAVGGPAPMHDAAEAVPA